MLATARPSCLILSHSLDGDVHVATSNAFERGSMVGYARVKMLAAGGGDISLCHAIPCLQAGICWISFLLFISIISALKKGTYHFLNYITHLKGMLLVNSISILTLKCVLRS